MGENLFNAFSFSFWDKESKKAKKEQKAKKLKKKKIEKLRETLLKKEEKATGDIDIEELAKMLQGSQFAVGAAAGTALPAPNPAYANDQGPPQYGETDDEDDMLAEIVPEAEKRRQVEEPKYNESVSPIVSRPSSAEMERGLSGRRAHSAQRTRPISASKSERGMTPVVPKGFKVLR